MNHQIVVVGDTRIAEVTALEKEVKSVDQVLDLIAAADGDGSSDVLLMANQVDPTFFDLSSGLAGEILQKFSTYRMRLAIVGNFERYPSTSLQAFIRESNRGSALFFCATREEAVTWLSGRAR